VKLPRRNTLRFTLWVQLIRKVIITLQVEALDSHILEHIYERKIPMKKILILLLITFMFCTGCNASNIKSNYEDEKLDISTSIVDELKKLDNNEHILFFANKDIDLDGKNEIIIAAGTPESEYVPTYFSQVLVFREEDNDLVQIDENLAGTSGYSVYEVKLIKMQDLPGEFLYLGLTNGVSLFGFSILELKNNHFIDFCYSASATGSGNDVLKDFNNDGQYDGYIKNRGSYDVLYFPVIRTYMLQGREFVLKGETIEVGDYPNGIIEVIMQYLSLIAIEPEISPEAKKRLSELCTDKDEESTAYIANYWHSAVLNTILDMDDKIEFDIVEEKDTAEVVAKFQSNNVEHKCVFHLSYADGRWFIDEVNYIFN
jgi:hypothetical protein